MTNVIGILALHIRTACMNRTTIISAIALIATSFWLAVDRGWDVLDAMILVGCGGGLVMLVLAALLNKIIEGKK